MTDAQPELVSTGGLAARLGYSVSGIQKMERLGRIPPGIVVEGSQRKVWRISDIPEIQRLLVASRGNGRRRTAA